MTFSIKPSHQFINPNPQTVKSEYKSKYAIDSSLTGTKTTGSSSKGTGNFSVNSATPASGMTIKTTVTSMEDYY